MGWSAPVLLTFCVIVLLTQGVLAHEIERDDNGFRFVRSVKRFHHLRQRETAPPRSIAAYDTPPSLARHSRYRNQTANQGSPSSRTPSGTSDNRTRNLTPIRESYRRLSGFRLDRIRRVSPIGGRNRHSYGMRAIDRLNNLPFGKEAQPLSLSQGGGDNAFGGVHSTIQQAVEKARRAAGSVPKQQIEGCMDPQDASYSRMASIHVPEMCDTRCSEEVAGRSLLPTIDPESISQLSNEAHFAVSIEISWKYLEATLSFQTAPGARTHTHAFSITPLDVFEQSDLMPGAGSGTGMWTREYTRQCYDTFIARIPWAEMDDLLWEMPDNPETLQGIIAVTTVEPVVFDQALVGRRNIPPMNRTWQGVLPFAMKLPGEVTVAGDNDVTP